MPSLPLAVDQLDEHTPSRTLLHDNLYGNAKICSWLNRTAPHRGRMSNPSRLVGEAAGFSLMQADQHQHDIRQILMHAVAVSAEAHCVCQSAH